MNKQKPVYSRKTQKYLKTTAKKPMVKTRKNSGSNRITRLKNLLKKIKHKKSKKNKKVKKIKNLKHPHILFFHTKSWGKYCSKLDILAKQNLSSLDDINMDLKKIIEIFHKKYTIHSSNSTKLNIKSTNIKITLNILKTLVSLKDPIQERNINIQDSDISIQFLASGSFNRAFLIYNKSNKSKQFVIRIMKQIIDGTPTQLDYNEEFVNSLNHRIFYEGCNCKSLIGIYNNGVYIDGQIKIPFQILEYGGVNLDKIKDWINNPTNIDGKKKIFSDLLKGVQCLNDINYCHNDIKLDNITVIFNNNKVIAAKLIDFGCMKPNNADGFCGTAGWLYPAMIYNEKFSIYNDLWALSIIFCIVFIPGFMDLYNNVVASVEIKYLEDYWNLLVKIQKIIFDSVSKNVNRREIIMYLQGWHHEGLEWNNMLMGRCTDACSKENPNHYKQYNTQYYNSIIGLISGKNKNRLDDVNLIINAIGRILPNL